MASFLFFLPFCVAQLAKIILEIKGGSAVLQVLCVPYPQVYSWKPTAAFSHEVLPAGC